MIVTKEEIVRSASRLFKERGFLSTSMQDVANDCRIAKGSVYKYFSSKEDLFCEVFERCQNEYFEIADALIKSTTGPDRARFLQQIILRFRYFTEYKRILIEFTELPIQQDSNFYKLRRRVRGRLMNWHKACILSFYGKVVEPYVWDVVCIYRAIINEYVSWIIHEVKPLPIDSTAEFVLEQLDVVVKHMLSTRTKPLLDEAAFESYLLWGLEGRQEERGQVTNELLDRVDLAIESLTSGEAHKCELREVSGMLREELGKDNPKLTLVRVLLVYLAKEERLRSTIVQLQNVTYC